MFLRETRPLEVRPKFVTVGLAVGDAARLLGVRGASCPTYAGAIIVPVMATNLSV